ncbi:MAG: nuclear transport factor 2 family protein [Alcanivorax sp.]|nr:nuclear transport factor 2 family protein [Alcanivorax sp.]
MKVSKLTCALISLLLLSSCSSVPKGPYGYTDSYLKARQQTPSCQWPDDAQMQAYLALFSPLREDYIDQHLDQVFAEHFYFNDTLVTLHDRSALKTHLMKTAKRLSDMSLRPLDVIHGHDQYVFLLWVMDAHFSVLGSKQLSRTIGISQLCFNDQGRVVFQQDFWDSSQGLDQHLPVIGPMTRWLRDH